MSDNIEEIYSRIQEIQNKLEQHNEVFHELIYQIQSISKIVGESHDVNIREHSIMKCTENNLPFEINDPRTIESEFFYPKIVSAEESIQKIIDEKKSIARFGDGEFSIIFGKERQPFQNCNSDLGKRLKEVLQSNQQNLMIGIADNYGSLAKYTDYTADGIRIYMQPVTRREHMKILDRNKQYYDAYLSRPYIIYRDNNTDGPRKRFEHLKQIWNKRDVVMIEGEQTRLGVGNDLFDNCTSIKRILVPSKNAYDRYDDVLQCALNNIDKDNLVLIATGPSAGVFAYDLAMNGYQAVDIGHVDVEYEWFLKGTGNREPLDNKYTNEIPGQEEAQMIQDPVYESQIIARFT